MEGPAGSEEWRELSSQLYLAGLEFYSISQERTMEESEK